VVLHELHTAGDEWFFSMELVEGVSFLEWVRFEPSGDEATAEVTVDERASALREVAAASVPAPRGPAVDLPRLTDALGQLVDWRCTCRASCTAISSRRTCW
jgi:hypothetical protein